MQDESSTPVAWVAAAIRFVAAWFVVNVLVALPGLMVTWRANPQFAGGEGEFFRANVYSTAVGVISTLVVAAALWSTSGALATHIWRQPAADETTEPSSNDLQHAVFAGLGLYFIVAGLPRLIELAYRYYTLPRRFGFEEQFQAQLVSGAISGAVSVAAGIALMFGARGLVNLLGRIRHSDDDDVDADEESPQDDGDGLVSDETPEE